MQRELQKIRTFQIFRKARDSCTVKGKALIKIIKRRIKHYA